MLIRLIDGLLVGILKKPSYSTLERHCQFLRDERDRALEDNKALSSTLADCRETLAIHTKRLRKLGRG